MSAGPIDLNNVPSLVLCFDPDLVEAVQLAGVGKTKLVCDRVVEIPGCPELERLTWQQLGELPRESLRIRNLVVLTMRGAQPRKASLGLRQCGPAPRCFLVNGHDSWIESNGRGSVTLALSSAVRRTIGKSPVGWLASRVLGHEVAPAWATPASTVRVAEEAVERASAQQPRAIQSPAKVVHFIGSLGAGGAERQLVMLARGQQARGHDVEVWTAYRLQGDDGHYVSDLERSGVKVRSLAKRTSLGGVSRKLGEAGKLVSGHHSGAAISALLLALRAAPVDVLHCWLDEPNVVGGIAGLLANVPRVVLSTRNVSPKHFPRLLRPWYQASYRAFSRSPRVVLIGNSVAGSTDYADWLELPPDRIHTVYNGFDPQRFQAVSAEERGAIREQLGLPADAFVLVGVFRLAVEKRPLDFVRVAARLRDLVPELRVIHLGVGAQEATARHEALRFNLDRVLDFRGRVGDPWRYLQSADATVLVSDNEGCPNVSLESQALGVPIVATAVGGTPETVVDGETGFLCQLGDVEGMAQRLAELAADPATRTRMGAAGKALIASKFGRERMVDETLALYRLG